MIPDDRGHATEGGYIIGLTALLLIPMLVFTAFATDVGAWYVRAQEVQRAADAAALAAVVWMPDENKAASVALDVAARNGFVDQVDSVDAFGNPDPTDLSDFDDPNASLPQVKVTRIGRQQVRVEIRAEGEVFFGSVVESFEAPKITRFATAEYILPVPMGNPTSALGSGSDTVNGDQDNFWLRAMGECEPRQTGDFIGSSSPSCIPTPVNPNHRPAGHTFVLDIPEGQGGKYKVQTRLSCAEFGGQQANASMRFTLYPPDATPLDDFDNTSQAPVGGTPITIHRPDASICPADGSGWSRASDPAPWVDISSWALAEGRWVLQAKNPAAAASVRSLYSLRLDPLAVPGGACSRLGPSGTPACPSIFAVDFLTVYSHGQMFDPAAGGRAELYLAEVDDDIHAGKTLEITMFDPAEGIDVTRILDPSGNPVPVSWRTIDVDEYGYTGFGSELVTTPVSQTCGGVPCVSESNADSGPTYSFQNRTIRMLVDIPVDSCVEIAGEPDNCWWKVLYEDSDANANETTTWSVRVIGDPVRLIE